MSSGECRLGKIPVQPLRPYATADQRRPVGVVQAAVFQNVFNFPKLVRVGFHHHELVTGHVPPRLFAQATKSARPAAAPLEWSGLSYRSKGPRLTTTDPGVSATAGAIAPPSLSRPAMGNMFYGGPLAPQPLALVLSCDQLPPLGGDDAANVVGPFVQQRPRPIKGKAVAVSAGIRLQPLADTPGA